MKILVVSFEFGRGSGPEGICVERLCRELLQSGHTILLVSAFPPPTDLNGRLQWVEGRTCRRRLFRTQGFTRVPNLPESVVNCDVVYGRAFPPESIELARRLAAVIRRPLFIHLSDPLPCQLSSAFSIKTTIRASLHKMYLKRALRVAKGVSFSTPQAAKLQHRITPTLSVTRTYVVRNIAVAVASTASPRIEPSRASPIVYVGSFYGSRSPQSLIEGHRMYIREGGRRRLEFVGTAPNSIRSWLQPSDAGMIEVRPFQSDVRSVYAGAGVLVSVDSMLAPPVYLSTKVIEYLDMPRPILAITPPGSPTAELLKDVGGAFVVGDSAEHVRDALLALDNDLIVDCEERQRRLIPFRGSTVIGEALAMLESSL